MYWTGLIQRIFKANAGNLSEQKKRKTTLRPTTKEPRLTVLTDTVIRLDEVLFQHARHSVGKGFIVQKKA